MNRGLRIGSGSRLGGLGAFGLRNSSSNPLSPTTIYFKDEFTTTEAAPMASPRNCEPIGTLTIVDTGNRLSIASGAIAVAAGGGHGDPALYGAIRARAAGLAVVSNIIIPATTDGFFGFDSDTSSTIGAGAIGCDAALASAYIGGVYVTNVGIADIRGSLFGLGVILRSTGAFFVNKPNGSSVWKLLWADNTLNNANVYPTWYPLGQNTQFHRFACVQLPSAWTTDAAAQTSNTASAGVGASATMEADALVEATWQAATGATYELDVRRTDDDNRWIIRCDQGGSTIKIIERNATVETERASAAQTWTNGNSYRIVALCDGTNIRAWVGIAAVKVSYASASFNQTATGVKTSHAVTNLIAWRRALTGTLSDALDAV